MNSNAKHTEWILETIDHLRRRKARPDLERICHVVRRRFGLSAAETEAKLEKLVDSETVIKVDYKGNTSYRNAAKWRKSVLGCAVLNSTTVSTKIIEAILDISNSQIHALEQEGQPEQGQPEQGQPECEQVEPEQALNIKTKISQYATEVGVTLESLNKWLRERCEGFDHLKSPLTVILKREIDAGRIKRLMSCNYVITPAQMEQVDDNGIRPLKTARKPENKSEGSPDGPGFGAGLSDESSSDIKASRSGDHVTSDSSYHVVSHNVVPQPARRGRPPKNKSQTTAGTSVGATPSQLKVSITSLTFSVPLLILLRSPALSLYSHYLFLSSLSHY